VIITNCEDLDRRKPNISKIIYIGKTGGLNKAIVNSLINSNSIKNNDVELIVVSAREVQELRRKQGENIAVVFGGRDVAPWLYEFSKLSTGDTLIYLNTYFYNDFHDVYLMKKSNEFSVIKKVPCNSVSLEIPFVDDCLKPLVIKLINERATDISAYQIKKTKFDYIASSIICEVNGELPTLLKNTIFLRLSLVEVLLWKIFSFMYRVANKLSMFKFNNVILNAIKLLEKGCHKLLFTHGISAVFIKKS
jgi:hypothetical protein